MTILMPFWKDTQSSNGKWPITPYMCKWPKVSIPPSGECSHLEQGLHSLKMKWIKKIDHPKKKKQHVQYHEAKKYMVPNKFAKKLSSCCEV